MIDCTILVSVGRNPVSGRARLAPIEAAAIAMAMRAGLRPRLLHAGPADAANVLRHGLGFGVGALDIIEMGAEDDPLPVLSDYLASRDIGLLLTGTKAETGEGSAMLPYLLAKILGRPIIEECLELQPTEEGSCIVRSTRPGGARQVIAIPLTTVIAVGPTARSAPLGSLSAAASGRVNIHTACAPRDNRYDIPLTPARAVPKPIRAPDTGQSNAVLSLDDVDEAAAAILELLKSASLIGSR